MRSNAGTMTLKYATCAAISLGFLSFAASEPSQKVVVTNTQHLDFPAGGELRVKDSTGELTIEGWDQPGAEITTTKSTKREYEVRERENATRELDKVHVVAQRQGGDLVVSTEFPKHRLFPPPSPLGSAVDFDLQYDIKVPRTARVLVDHNTGEVNIDSVTGEIHVTDKQGLILLHLAENRQYAIDARSGLGSVDSDFAGAEKRTPLLLGHSFMENPSGAAQKLYLRIHYGDIVILRQRIPQPPAPAAH